MDPNLVCKIIYYMKVLEPLVEMMRSNQFTLDMIAEGEFVIRKLTQFLKSGAQQEGANSARGTKSNHLNKEIQNAYRELSILDLCIKFIYLYAGYEIPRYEEDYELFLNSIIGLINLACQDNQFNCYYIFQWYKLLVGMILGEVNLDSGHPCRIEVDKLLATIFDTTGINVSVVGGIISSLLENYSFEKFDIKRINLLYSLLKIPDG